MPIRPFDQDKMFLLRPASTNGQDMIILQEYFQR